MCSKVTHNSRGEAQLALIRLCRKVGDDPDHFVIYECSGCWGYHFGHKPEYRRKQLFPAIKPKSQYAYW